MNILLASVRCPRCEAADVLHVTPCGEKRKGFALYLKLTCSSCGTEVNSTYSSPQLETGAKPKPHSINDTMVLFFNRLGLGHTAVKEFCGILGIPAHALEDVSEEAACDHWQDDQGDGRRDADKCGHRSQDAHETGP